VTDIFSVTINKTEHGSLQSRHKSDDDYIFKIMVMNCTCFLTEATFSILSFFYTYKLHETLIPVDSSTYRHTHKNIMNWAEC